MPVLSEDPLVERVRDLAGFGDRLQGETRQEFDRILARLEQPLRIAVAGHVKAGKSTLVNALLGQAAAPTDVGECTKLVTWFQYGVPERVEVRMRDGSKFDLALEEGKRVPRELPVQIETVASLRVFLANQALSQITVIDTPGLGSVDAEASLPTAELLALDRASREATDAADAVAYVLGPAVRQTDVDMLSAWHGAGDASAEPDHGPPAPSAVNAIGVLTKADKAGDGKDPWPTAGRLARRQAERIGERVAVVVPVIGLLAETARTGGIGEPEAAQLIALAELDDQALELLLWSRQDFLESDCTIGPEARRRLWDRLDLFGLGFAIERVRQGDRSTAAITEALLEASGITELEKALHANFMAERRDLLRLRSALDAMNRLTYRAPDETGVALRRAVEALRLDPAMHELAELDALHSVLTHEIELPDPLRVELIRMAGSRPAHERLGVPVGDDDALRQAALDAIRRWRTFMNADAAPRQAQVARVVIRRYTMILESGGQR